MEVICEFLPVKFVTREEVGRVRVEIVTNKS